MNFQLYMGILLCIPALAFRMAGVPGAFEGGMSADIQFVEDSVPFSESEKELIRGIVQESEREIRELLPGLPEAITVNLEIVNWDLRVVGGVTGRTESNRPPVVSLQLSSSYPGGVSAAARTALRQTLYHEFHHLSLGWAISDNRFQPGIATAAAIEGLAVVFSEIYTGVAFDENQPPADHIAASWAKEILGLPADANYQHWMFSHPDGRKSVGYRIGKYIVTRALLSSGTDIRELSQLTPEEIWRLAGF